MKMLPTQLKSRFLALVGVGEAGRQALATAFIEALPAAEGDTYLAAIIAAAREIADPGSLSALAKDFRDNGAHTSLFLLVDDTDSPIVFPQWTAAFDAMVVVPTTLRLPQPLVGLPEKYSYSSVLVRTAFWPFLFPGLIGTDVADYRILFSKPGVVRSAIGIAPSCALGTTALQQCREQLHAQGLRFERLASLWAVVGLPYNGTMEDFDAVQTAIHELVPKKAVMMVTMFVNDREDDAASLTLLALEA